MSEPREEFDRYHRQMLLPGIGERGQRLLRERRALLVGCGALGTNLADTLARAGIGGLSIIDRDVVERTNLQRQVLFDEDDAVAARPKAVAARDRLARVNSDVDVRAHIDDFNAGNAERFLDDADLILDGLDNFETRYLLNDLAVKHGMPYVYGGAVGTTGMTMTVLPHPKHRAHPPRSRIQWDAAQSTPCLRCVFPEAPPPGSTPTCDTAGVLGPAVTIIAAHQAAQALKLLTGNLDALDRSMLSLELWSNEQRRFDLSSMDAGAELCPCCGQGRFEALERGGASRATSLCGREAVQVNPATDVTIDLAALHKRLAAHGAFTVNEHLLRGTFARELGHEGRPIELMLFPTGRAIIKGTTEPDQARAVYARYIGM